MSLLILLFIIFYQEFDMYNNVPWLNRDWDLKFILFLVEFNGLPQLVFFNPKTESDNKMLKHVLWKSAAEMTSLRLL